MATKRLNLIIKSLEGEYGEKLAGWKIHLNVNPADHPQIYQWLQSVPCGSDYNHNNNKGEDFTVYSGSWDATQKLAERIEKEIGRSLRPITEQVLRKDLPVLKSVAAGFDTKNKTFSKFRIHGIPLLMDNTRFMFEHVNELKDDKDSLNLFVERAYNALSQTYGTYFSGTQNQVSERLQSFLNIK